jgi:threonine synthase
MKAGTMSIWRWPDLADGIPPSTRLTLGEGETPLVPSRRIGPALGLNRLFFKLETTNPTGSYKDRFAARAIGHMLASGQTRCLATSSGNTGAALAAYSAAAGLGCEIAVVESAPESKLQQMHAYGADIYRVRGFGLDPEITTRAFEHLRRRAQRADTALQISAYCFSPHGMAGVQSIAYELAEQAPEAIDHVFCPAGGGGLTLAVARGFERLLQKKSLTRGPRIECVQPAGNDTIAGPLRRGEASARAVACTSQISGLQVPDVLDGNETLSACRRSGGTGHLVEDEAVWEAQARLARDEGSFSEPAGATALAGALQAARAGEIAPDAVVVCLVTGTGFKDLVSVERMVQDRGCPMVEVEALLAPGSTSSTRG